MPPTDSGTPGPGGKIEQLFIKTVRGGPTTACVDGASLQCVADCGIEGDVHANRLSPRQILITLNADLQALAIPPGALHENVVISLSSPAHFRPGAALVTSGGVEIKLTMYCEPCSRIAPLIPNLRQIVHRRGILGTIARGGAITAGDAFRLIPDKYAALPESAVQRFLEFVSKIPEGKVVRYSDVATGMGVASSFIRALPGYIRRNTHAGAPLHRIVTAHGRLLKFIPDQARMLAAEGVRIEGSGASCGKVPAVDLANFLWRG